MDLNLCYRNFVVDDIELMFTLWWEQCLRTMMRKEFYIVRLMRFNTLGSLRWSDGRYHSTDVSGDLSTCARWDPVGPGRVAAVIVRVQTSAVTENGGVNSDQGV